ncbi:hypothetical protein [Exiguobacterium sp. AM39-5BH]|uniref:hypothetical protein n=1 Tax=Exiguobacterium sp. AM39-5BH TaxID=2292355 RepID=UPI000FE26EA5|nr:hypothetical protein [Exiguobacterium sp. AM39-5BH]RHB48797.1 hypothetical protein DW881_10795 [Exiguobacterium sp. AM39-5BH]
MRQFDVRTRFDTSVDTLWTLLQDASLLSKLTSFPKVTLVGDGASVEGNVVQLRIGVGPISLPWNSAITLAGDRAFCDQGVKLPFPFRRFSHVHRVEQVDGQAVMVDEVTFDSYVPAVLVEYFVLRPMFKARAEAFQKTLNS